MYQHGCHHGLDGEEGEIYSQIEIVPLVVLIVEDLDHKIQMVLHVLMDLDVIRHIVANMTEIVKNVKIITIIFINSSFQ